MFGCTRDRSVVYATRVAVFLATTITFQLSIYVVRARTLSLSHSMRWTCAPHMYCLFEPTNSPALIGRCSAFRDAALEPSPGDRLAARETAAPPHVR